jgi:hypothetical protein
MPTTPDLLLPYPAATDPADVPVDMQELAERIDTVAGAASGLATLDATTKVPIAQLPAGTANGLATLDATGKVPAAQLPAVGGAGAMIAIGEIDLTATGDFTNIPQVYDHLRLVIRARSTQAVVTLNNLLRFNDDVSASYYWSVLIGQNNAASSTQPAAQTAALIGAIPGAGAAAGNLGSADILISDYARTGFGKVLLGTAFTLSDPRIELFGASCWLGGAAITKVSVLPTGGGAYAAGSRAWLYGISGA